MSDLYTDITDEQAEGLARQFHENYERLAPDFGYKTREESAKPWSEVPQQNKELMKAVMHKMFGRDIHYFIKLRNGIH